jgi:hypothetical protein
MKTVVARVKLPQRVPYGLHGNWFSEEEILNQRPVERIRSLPTSSGKTNAMAMESEGVWMDVWMGIRKWMLEVVG